MAEDERRQEEENAELLPPREVMSLLNTDPSAYAGLLGDPTGAAAPSPDAGTASPDPTAGIAGSAMSQAQGLAGAHAAGDGTQDVSDQPQTITTDTTDTASSET